MTRVIDGIYDTVELETGFFITDKQADMIAEWLTSYANALEKTWIKKGSVGDPKIQKFAYVRSFPAAIERMRCGEKKSVESETKPQSDNGETNNG